MTYHTYKPENVAYWFIAKANKTNTVLSGSRIHTLTYFAEAWVQALLRRNLFVSPELTKSLCLAAPNGMYYEDLANLGINASEYIQPSLELLIQANPKSQFDPDVNQILEDVWRTYGTLSTYGTATMLKLYHATRSYYDRHMTSRPFAYNSQINNIIDNTFVQILSYEN